MGGKRGLANSGATDEPKAGKEVADQAEQTRREASADRASKTQSKMSQGTRRARKSDI
jgi:hypothetical protein